MRLNNYLFEDGLSSGNGSVGGTNTNGVEGNPGTGGSVGGGTTTKNIAKFYNKIGSEPARRKKKKKRRRLMDTDDELNDNIIQDIYMLASYKINEGIVPDIIFNNVREVGKKVGLNVKRSDTFFDYLEVAGKEFIDLYNLLCLYLLSSTPSERSSLKSDIKQELSKVNGRRLTAFILMADKMSFGITSLIRHILMSVFGIEISTYNKWDSDISYILSHLSNVGKVLMKMSPTDEEIEAYNNLYNIILKTKEEVESSRK